MLVQGFSIDGRADDAGLATGESDRIVAGNYRDDRTRVRITEAGRRALGE